MSDESVSRGTAAARDQALRWALNVARGTEWQPDGNGGPLKCFTCGAYSTNGHNRPCARFDKFIAAEDALAEAARIDAAAYVMAMAILQSPLYEVAELRAAVDAALSAGGGTGT